MDTPERFKFTYKGQEDVIFSARKTYKGIYEVWWQGGQTEYEADSVEECLREGIWILY